MNKKTKSTILRDITIGILIFSVIALIFYFFVFNPILKTSYISMTYSCFPENLIIIDEGIKVGKDVFVVIGVFDPSSNEISVDKRGSEEDVLKRTKHEMIHKKQFENGRMFNCKFNGFFRFLNEAEAYTFSRLPDWIFNKIY